MHVEDYFQYCQKCYILDIPTQLFQWIVYLFLEGNEYAYRLQVLGFKLRLLLMSIRAHCLPINNHYYLLMLRLLELFRFAFLPHL